VTPPSNPSRRSAIATVAVVVSFFFVVGLAGWAWFNCIDATYNCPANGCGQTSPPGCSPILEFLPYLLAGGILSGALAFGVAIRPREARYADPGT
jgi:hypothetical protein